MVFGKIDYINLLPFHVFLKKSSLPSAFKRTSEYQKAVPSEVNRKFRRRRVDAAFISSIESGRLGVKRLGVGIVAQRNVKSVLVKTGEPKSDPASATSNMLAKVLGFNGEVFIGDRALKLYLQEPNAYIDLGEQWYKKHRLPFVFGRLCANGHVDFYKKLSARFAKERVKIPRYILSKYAIERGIKESDILDYLNYISYKVGKKEQKGFEIFLKKARQIKH